MALSRKEKKQILDELVKNLQEAHATVLVDYQGLSVSETDELRQSLHDEGARIVIVKNTLLKKAFQEAGLAFPEEQITGPRAVAFGFADEVAPARILHTFAKKHENMELIAGSLGKENLDLERVTMLAKLPTKHEMLGKTVATIAAPLSSFVNVMAGTPRALVYALQAIADHK